MRLGIRITCHNILVAILNGIIAEGLINAAVGFKLGLIPPASVVCFGLCGNFIRCRGDCRAAVIGSRSNLIAPIAAGTVFRIPAFQNGTVVDRRGDNAEVLIVFILADDRSRSARLYLKISAVGIKGNHRVFKPMRIQRIILRIDLHICLNLGAAFRRCIPAAKGVAVAGSFGKVAVIGGFAGH